MVKQDHASALASSFLYDPSPDIFVGALSIFAFVGLCIHSHHTQDQYQNHILIAGAICAAVLSSVIYMMFDEISWYRAIQSHLASSVMIALSLSVVVHRPWGLAIPGTTEQPYWQEKETCATELKANGKLGRSRLPEMLVAYRRFEKSEV